MARSLYGQSRRSGRPLLDYAHLSVYSRAGEAAAVDPRAGWAFYDTTTPWPADDVPRVLSDGAILIEPARTNLILRNREFNNTGVWNVLTGTITPTQSAPDGSTARQRVQSSAGARLGPEQTGSFTGCLGSLYVTNSAGSGYYILYMRGNDDGYFFGTSGVDWARISGNGATGFYYVQDGRGHAVLVGGAGEAANDCDAVLDLAQDEVGSYITSPIR